MLTFPQIDPVAVNLGPIQVHWYGLMYLLAFLGGYWLLRYRIRVQPLTTPVTPAQASDWLFYIVLGAVLGGRIGYIIFYNFDAFLANPLVLFKVWQGGMSFHGGFLGVLVTSWLYGRKIGATVMHMTDFIAPIIPFGLLCGRIGNFINGELWGRPTSLPWGMVFPHVDALARHPSMLYQALLEGVALWLILWIFSIKVRPRCAVSGMFLICYGIFRFFVEFVREPDEHIGFLAFDWLTMGQLLCMPMILFGVALMIIAYRNH